jgi:predicted RND superfamily exporter protein
MQNNNKRILYMSTDNTATKNRFWTQPIRVYDYVILNHPLLLLIAVLLVSAFFAYHTPDFELDASADTLTLENDQALKYYRSVRARYGSDDFLIVTYTPDRDMFDPEVLDDIKSLRDRLAALENIASVTSLLDVPLIESPPVTFTDISKEINTLENGKADIELARKEFTTSPVYRNLIMSPDGKTTAMQVNFKHDDKYFELLNERNSLRELQLQQPLTPAQALKLEEVSRKFDDYHKLVLDRQSREIVEVRKILDMHRDDAVIYLGGVPMIAADSIDFIRHDLVNFGTGVLVFLVVLLAVSFKRLRWVLLPMFTCLITVVIVIGLLGLLNWPVTVVSSNFVSLLLIITLSLSVHLIVRYRELHAQDSNLQQHELVLETIKSKFAACFYTAMTTIVAFGSLLFSGIRPVIDFGWMMSIGIVIAFMLAFTLFPATLMLLKPGKEATDHDLTEKVICFFAYVIERYSKVTLAVFTAVIVLSLVGMTRLSVENRFIDYFKENTEIYQGMSLIDKSLGGTTPMDIILDAPAQTKMNEPLGGESLGGEDAFLDELFEDIKDDAGITATSYWFNEVQLRDVEKIHDYLDSLPETGKVLSVITAIRMLETLNEGETVDDFFLSILYKRLPDEIKEQLIRPYMTEDGNQLRFNVRVYESDPDLQREALIEQVEQKLTTDFALEDEQVHVSGMLVLYNNMLQSLFQSQIMTLGVVFIAIMVMFFVSFRSIKLALIAIVPNVVAAAQVLGIMGWLNISLDIMTITIAAIVIGIAVDDTIHFVHRFGEEITKDYDYWAAVERCHSSIGRAMYYTTVTITLGFLILVLSNFIPTIYFGLLTGFSMVVALVADLMLLPVLLVMFKPYGTAKTATA